jgi:hypothetical protein
MQGQQVSEAIVEAFQTTLQTLSRHFTDTGRAASGAPALEAGCTPADHWAQLHSFLERVLACLAVMPQHAAAAERFGSAVVGLVHRSHSALQVAMCAPCPPHDPVALLLFLVRCTSGSCATIVARDLCACSGGHADSAALAAAVPSLARTRRTPRPPRPTAAGAPTARATRSRATCAACSRRCVRSRPPASPRSS